VPLPSPIISSQEFFEHGGEFFHGYTYSGHPVASAVALENLRIMQTEDMVGNANRMEAVVRDKIGALADHPIVGEVRVKGLLGAIELVKDKKTRERFADWGRVGTICRDHCFQQQPRHARLLGHDGVLAAAVHHRSRDRRVGRPCPQGARCNLGSGAGRGWLKLAIHVKSAVESG
jgi:adenosylmethionine-8-amino-7-oxononanoate aminotransferase